MVKIKNNLFLIFMCKIQFFLFNNSSSYFSSYVSFFKHFYAFFNIFFFSSKHKS